MVIKQNFDIIHVKLVLIYYYKYHVTVWLYAGKILNILTINHDVVGGQRYENKVYNYVLFEKKTKKIATLILILCKKQTNKKYELASI